MALSDAFDTRPKQDEVADVVLIGAGIMSATLGILLKELNPNCRIEIYERLDEAARESSDAWNNAGTGHAAFCELNYTPENPDGSIAVEKAIAIAQKYELSRQFWAYLIENHKLYTPSSFIRRVPHWSFVWGAENTSFLKKRYEALKEHPLFAEMRFWDQPDLISEHLPLVMHNRDQSVPVAATAMEDGTDVDFGNLTRKMMEYLMQQPGVTVRFNHEVKKLKQTQKGHWKLKIKDTVNNSSLKSKATFVFIGAGGYSLLLLEKTNVTEGEGYGGFPVGGQWLRCTNPEVINRHFAKVYGKATVGTPPMSVPHLDTRIINGKRELLFGPFAGFSTKFLKNGSYLDLIDSLEMDNLKPMLYAGWNNIPLTKYLIEQVMQSQEDRIEALREYFPDAQTSDWEILEAGQRVQVIKKDEKEGGILEFGTELITTSDGSLACLLGASPGASTAVAAMIEVVECCFSEEFKSLPWQTKLHEMVPSYGISLNANPELCQAVRQRVTKLLAL